MAHLQGQKLNLQYLRDFARREFADCFSQIQGSKSIGWCDDSLRDALNLIVEMPYLQELDVIKMFYMEKGAAIPDIADNVVFISKPDLETIQLIGDLVAKTREHNQSCNHVKMHIMFVPRKCYLCEEMLMEMGADNQFEQILECAFEFYPLDNDLFSMECPESFRECQLDDDYSSLYVAARGLNTLQGLYGTIPRIYGKGKAAELVFHYMARMKGESNNGGGSASTSEVTPHIDNLLLIDRAVDLISVLPTQLTYEGLLDESVGIRSTACRLPASIFRTDEQKQQGTVVDAQELKKILLSSADALYAETRDRDYRLVGPHLVKKLDYIRETYQKHKQKDTSMAELKLFTSNLPHLVAEKESVSKHTAIATVLKEKSSSMKFKKHVEIEQNMLFNDNGPSLINSATNNVDMDKPIPYIECCIAKEEPITKVLRLICLQSVLNNGLKQKVLDFYKREIIQTYGYQYLKSMLNLENSGLLANPSSKTMASIKKTLKLVDPDFNFRQPSDIMCVFDGYAPLSVRLAQFMAAPGWRSIDEILKVLPGPKVEERQEVPAALRKKLDDVSPGGPFIFNPENPQVTLVFFLGGVTFAEIAALRYLTIHEENGIEFIIGTTAVINGDTFIESLMDDYSKAFDTSDMTSYASGSNSAGAASGTGSSQKKRSLKRFPLSK